MAEADLGRGASRAARPARSQRCTEPRCRLRPVEYSPAARTARRPLLARARPLDVRSRPRAGHAPRPWCSRPWESVHVGTPWSRGADSDAPTPVTFRYAILGGLLVRAPGSWIAFTRTRGSPLEVRSEVDGFFAARGATSPSRLERRPVPTCRPAFTSPSGDGTSNVCARRPPGEGRCTRRYGHGWPLAGAAAGRAGRCRRRLPAPSPTTSSVRNVVADVTDSEALGRALEGVDVVYYLVRQLPRLTSTSRIASRRRRRLARPNRRCPPDRLPRRSRRRS